MKEMICNGTLRIKELELKVNLGWRDKEQLSPQAIMCDIEVYFNNEPEAANTDDLADTICYDKLIQKIRAHISPKSYRLVEHLAKEIYDIVKNELPAQGVAIVSVTKKPKIEGLIGGVTYTVYPSSKE